MPLPPCTAAAPLCQDLLPASGVRYFRFQPTIPSSFSIDETDIAKLVELQAAGRAYVSAGGAGAEAMAELVHLLNRT